MKFIRADKEIFDVRHDMSVIFVDGWYQWLKYLSKDKDRLINAFKHIFQLDKFYVAIIDNQVASMVACTKGKPAPLSLDKKILCKTLGVISGHIAYHVLNKHLVYHPYPFLLPNDTGSVEFVATSPKFKGKGIAYHLVNHAIENSHFDKFVLEVMSDNDSAIKLYTKLGFKEFTRKPAPKRSGVEYSLYMKK